MASQPAFGCGPSRSGGSPLVDGTAAGVFRSDLMFVKKHESQNETIVAVCDEELVGKVLREGERVLDLSKYSSFYVGELATEEEAWGIMKDATSLNLVGKKAVGLAIKKKLAKKGDAMTVQGVPHLQVYKL